MHYPETIGPLSRFRCVDTLGVCGCNYCRDSSEIRERENEHVIGAHSLSSYSLLSSTYSLPVVYRILNTALLSDACMRMRRAEELGACDVISIANINAPLSHECQVNWRENRNARLWISNTLRINSAPKTFMTGKKINFYCIMLFHLYSVSSLSFF